MKLQQQAMIPQQDQIYGGHAFRFITQIFVLVFLTGFSGFPLVGYILSDNLNIETQQINFTIA